ncbi:hypothetical protein MVI01_61300 [Myxococcus virescens]|uniref:Uncharacterized protein n=1 Tax=Myxococcus virescens TaxID=83456 RepID=A0A511HL85_9BACT|nr:hypothetical protein MVI01_61300 [Myxococcus virescens]
MTPVPGGASAVLTCPRDGDTNLPTDTLGTAPRLLMAAHDECVTVYSGHRERQGSTWGQKERGGGVAQGLGQRHK